MPRARRSALGECQFSLLPLSSSAPPPPPPALPPLHCLPRVKMEVRKVSGVSLQTHTQTHARARFHLRRLASRQTLRCAAAVGVVVE